MKWFEMMLGPYSAESRGYYMEHSVHDCIFLVIDKQVFIMNVLEGHDKFYYV